jgi:hypothetical protein
MNPRNLEFLILKILLIQTLKSSIHTQAIHRN